VPNQRQMISSFFHAPRNEGTGSWAQAPAQLNSLARWVPTAKEFLGQPVFQEYFGTKIEFWIMVELAPAFRASAHGQSKRPPPWKLWDSRS
jgi:hypothetical protein